MSKTEFIKLNAERYAKAAEVAARVILMDNRFIGLDGLRKPCIERAALIALGMPNFPNKPLADIAVTDPELSRELNTLIERAAGAAKEKIEQAA